jgi:DNA-binding NtrC family response regulator
LDDPGEIDLLFTGIRLPEGDLGGLELAEQSRAKNPDLKALYTTGDTITDSMKVMFVAGGEMLRKPYTAPELAAATAGSSRTSKCRITVHKRKAPNRCAWLGARSAFFFARAPGGKPARANHIFG